MLLPSLNETELRQRATAIRKRALTNQEERSLDTLYIALGLATWQATDGGRPAPAEATTHLPTAFHVLHVIAMAHEEPLTMQN